MQLKKLTAASLDPPKTQTQELPLGEGLIVRYFVSPTLPILLKKQAMLEF